MIDLKLNTSFSFTQGDDFFMKPTHIERLLCIVELVYEGRLMTTKVVYLRTLALYSGAR